MDSLLFFPVMLAIIAVVLGVQALYLKKRREAWAAVAATRGLEVVGSMDLLSCYPAFKSFSLGRLYQAPIVLRGRSGGARVLLGDFSDSNNRGRGTETHQHTFCILERDDMDLPHCFMRPQNAFDALGKVFGGRDIDFGDDLEFSKAFVLQGEDEGAIRARFDRPTRAWLVAHRDRISRFEAGGRTLAFFAPRMEPAQAAKLLDEAINFLVMWS